MKSKRGFTLVELIVVIAIISLISTIVIANLVQARGRARDSAYIQSVREIEKALEVYYIHHDSYPLTTVALGITEAQCNSSSNQGYITGGLPSSADTWIPDLVPGYISALPKYPASRWCNNVILPTFFGYKSCDGENYRLILNCILDNPLPVDDPLSDQRWGFWGTQSLTICRGDKACALSGTY